MVPLTKDGAGPIELGQAGDEEKKMRKMRKRKRKMMKRLKKLHTVGD